MRMAKLDTQDLNFCYLDLIKQRLFFAHTHKTKCVLVFFCDSISIFFLALSFSLCVSFYKQFCCPLYRLSLGENFRWLSIPTEEEI